MTSGSARSAGRPRRRWSWRSTAGTLTEQREAFDVPEPTLPKPWLDEYHEAYGGHESDFIVYARGAGFDSATVRELRDAGIRLAIEAEGKPVSDEVFGALAKKFSGRVNEAQFKLLKTWWRAEVERAS